LVKNDWQGLAPRAALRGVQEILENAGCPDADFDARELLRSVLGEDPRLAAAPLTEASAERLAGLTERRAAREPLQYLLGEWEFMGIPLAVGPGVLCPRADSEAVCEAAIAKLHGAASPRVLDLCAGTGCLGLGVARFVPGAQVICVEKSGAAWPYLIKNTRGTAVQAVRADVFSYYKTLPDGGADLILSNPPYLTAAEMDDLMPETAQEPAAALFGGTDGLAFYRLLLGRYAPALRPGGWIVLEIGAKQRDAVLALAARYGWQNAACGQDYGGNDRVISAQRPEKIPFITLQNHN